MDGRGKRRGLRGRLRRLTAIRERGFHGASLVNDPLGVLDRLDEPIAAGEGAAADLPVERDDEGVPAAGLPRCGRSGAPGVAIDYFRLDR